KSIHIAEMAHVFSASDGGPHKRFVAVSGQKPALLLAAMLVGAGPLAAKAVLGGRGVRRLCTRPRVRAAHSLRGGFAGQGASGIRGVYVPYIQAALAYLLAYGQRKELKHT